MSDPVYDTHDFVRRLHEAGMPDKQAEVLAAENMHMMTEILATKEDIRVLETVTLRQFADLRAQVAEYRAELKADVADVRRELSECRLDLKTEIVECRSELKADIADVRRELADCRSELKADIADVRRELADCRAELKADIASLRVDMSSIQNRVDSLENRLLIRLGGLVIAVQAAALAIGSLF